MKIVTGYRGTPHISSNDDQGRNQGAFGAGNFVLNVGNKFAATLTDATTVSIQDGEGMLQGVHFRVLPGTVDTVNIENGTQGYNRIDLICARYTKEAVTGIESVEWVVITGTPSASTPTEPSYNEGDVLDGDTIVDFPIFKVSLSGLTPTLTRIPRVRNAFEVFHTVGNQAIAANGEYSQTIKFGSGLWLIWVEGGIHYLSGTIQDNDMVQVILPIGSYAMNLFSGQYEAVFNLSQPVHATPDDDTYTIAVQNLTSKAGTLRLNIYGVQIG